MNNGIIGVGIAGYGLSGSVFHAPLLKDNQRYEVRSVWTRQHQRCRQDFPTSTIVSSFEELLQSKDVDLVVIATPNSLHFPLAKTALRAGKHVVLEKPFVTSIDEGKELIDLAKHQGKILSVFHNRRWDDDFLTIKKILAQDIIGDWYTYEAHFDRFRPEVDQRWKESNDPGGGVVFDLGSHLIDQSLCLFGKPDDLQLDMECQRPGAVQPDYFCLTLRYGKKRLRLRSSSLVAQPLPSYVINGTKGSLWIDGIDPQEQQLREGLRPSDPTWARRSHTQGGARIFIKSEQSWLNYPMLRGDYPSFYAQLADAITQDGPIPVPASEALAVIEIIQRGYQQCAWR